MTLFAFARLLPGAKPSWITMPYLATWETGITLATLPWDDMTHVSEAFALPGYNGVMPTMAAPGARANLVTTAHANGTRAVLSVGGATGDNAAWASSVTPAYRNTFIANLMTMMANGGYDGIDIDWEFPTAAERTNFTAFMQGLYDAMHNPANANYKGLAFDGGQRSLSFYISPGYFVCGVDWNVMGSYCDFAVLPGYDQCSGGFEGPIGGNYPGTDCNGTSYNVTVSGNMAKLAGGAPYNFPKSKLVLGMPFYNCAGNRLETITATGTHSSFNATAMESTWSTGAVVNDSDAFCAKINWALGQGFQGIAMWELSQAYPRNGTSEVAEVWDVIGGKNGCITVAGTPTFTRTRSPTPSFTRTATPAGSPTHTPSVTASPTPWVRNVPGRVQAEDFNAYSDSSAGNSGGAAYRPGDVDIETTTDTGGGYNVGYTVAGESLTYLLQVTAGGAFSLTLRMASAGPGPLSVQIEVDGSPVGGAVTVPVTGGWQAWADVAGPNLSLSTGQHTLRVVFITGDINFNYMDILALSTPTPSFTRTATRTVTPTGTSSGTRTATRSVTATSTPTQTSAISSTFTPTSTATGTRSATASASPTQSPVNSATPSFSPSATRTATSTATRSATLTASPTLTVTRTATGSSTPTATRSATGTVSPSWTASPIASDTASPTESPTLTLSPVLSATPTATGTATPSSSPTGSATSSATATFTGTDTPSVSPTDSPTLSATPSATQSPAFSATPSPTATLSGTASPVASATHTPTLSSSPTRTASPSPTLGFTHTATPSATRSPAPSPTETPTETPGNAVPTSTPDLGPGQLVIEEAQVMPLPILSGGRPPRFFVNLKGRAEGLRWRLYTRAYVVCGQGEQRQALGAGWNQGLLDLPADLAAGSYFLELRAHRQGLDSPVRTLKVVVLR